MSDPTPEEMAKFDLELLEEFEAGEWTHIPSPAVGDPASAIIVILPAVTISELKATADEMGSNATWLARRLIAEGLAALRESLR